MRITVAYATPEKQVELPQEVAVGTSVLDALSTSGVFEIFPEIDREDMQVGIFGKRAKLSDVLVENDRVEIYRPLQVDPKEARRLRAAKKAKADL